MTWRRRLHAVIRLFCALCMSSVAALFWASLAAVLLNLAIGLPKDSLWFIVAPIFVVLFVFLLKRAPAILDETVFKGYEPP